MDIRTAVEGELNFILDVLNEATLDLQQKGINQWQYPWEADDVLEAIRNEHCFVLLSKEKIIGTFTMHEIKSISCLTLPEPSMYLCKIAIHPDYQGKDLGSHITRFACEFARNRNKKLYLDCWARNEKLKAFYVKNGFEYIGDIPEEDYFISIFEGGQARH